MVQELPLAQVNHLQWQMHKTYLTHQYTKKVGSAHNSVQLWGTPVAMHLQRSLWACCLCQAVTECPRASACSRTRAPPCWRMPAYPCYILAPSVGSCTRYYPLLYTTIKVYCHAHNFEMTIEYKLQEQQYHCLRWEYLSRFSISSGYLVSRCMIVGRRSFSSSRRHKAFEFSSCKIWANFWSFRCRWRSKLPACTWLPQNLAMALRNLNPASPPNWQSHKHIQLMNNTDTVNNCSSSHANTLLFLSVLMKDILCTHRSKQKITNIAYNNVLFSPLFEWGTQISCKQNFECKTHPTICHYRTMIL